jgi:hypothetical protein
MSTTLACLVFIKVTGPWISFTLHSQRRKCRSMVVPPYLYNRSLLLALLTCAFDCFQFCLSLSPLLAPCWSQLPPQPHRYCPSVGLLVHINTSTHAYPPLHTHTHAQPPTSSSSSQYELLITDDLVDLSLSTHHVSQHMQPETSNAANSSTSKHLQHEVVHHHRHGTLPLPPVPRCAVRRRVCARYHDRPVGVEDVS